MTGFSTLIPLENGIESNLLSFFIPNPVPSIHYTLIKNEYISISNTPILLCLDSETHHNLTNQLYIEYQNVALLSIIIKTSVFLLLYILENILFLHADKKINYG